MVKRKFLCMVLLSLFLVSCATVEGFKADMRGLFSRKPEMKYYADYEKKYLEPLKGQIDKANKAEIIMLAGTAVGAVAGGVVGAVSSNANPVAVAAGAATGGFLGYSIGYVQAKKIKISDDEERYNFYKSDIKENNKSYNDIIMLEKNAILELSKELDNINKNKENYSNEEYKARCNELNYAINEIRKCYDNSIKNIDKVIKVTLDIPSTEEKSIKDDLQQNRISSAEYDKKNKEIQKLKRDLKKNKKELEKTKKENEKFEKKIIALERHSKLLEEEITMLKG